MKPYQFLVGIIILAIICNGLATSASSRPLSTRQYLHPNQISMEEAFLFSSYFGGDSRLSNDDRGSHVCLGPDGSIYILLYSSTQDWATVNAYYDSYRGGESDIVLLKLNSDCTDLLYCGYFGGNGRDFALEMTVDNQDNVFIVGETTSTDFATTGAFDETLNGSNDAFIMKYSPSTDTLHYATYLGGSNADWANSLTVDDEGNAFVTGWTSSPDFPLYDAHDSTLNGTRDAFVLKMNSEGNAILYSSFLGGEGSDIGNDMALGSDGAVYVTGETSSTDFYCTTSAYDSIANGMYDIFLTKLGPDDNDISFSTLVGGSMNEKESFCVVDDEGNTYLTCSTESPNFPIVDAWQESNNGESDIAIFTISPDGSNLLYSSFIGGNNDDSPRGIALDQWGCIYIAGGSNSDDYPVANGYDTVLEGTENPQATIECVVSKLDPTTNRLLFSSFLGGEENDDPEGIALDADCNIIVVGMTNSDEFPCSTDAYQSEFYEGEWDAFLSVIYDWGDMDEDQLADCQETAIGTDRSNIDTDADLMPDGWEFAYGLNATNRADASYDMEPDDLINLDEYLQGTDPLNFDSDSDTIPDGWEYFNGYDPLDDYVPPHEVLHYNSPLIIAGISLVVVFSSIYYFRTRYKRVVRKEGPVDSEETSKALEELTREFSMREISEALEELSDTLTLDVDVERLRVLEMEANRLEELETAIESKIKPALVERGAMQEEVSTISILFLTRDRESLDTLELEVLEELEAIMDVPSPHEIYSYLSARSELESKIKEFRGVER